jgi:hypothetical protein
MGNYMADVLFILKRKENYGVQHFEEPKGLSTGLLNSASFMVDMLLGLDITAELEVAIDNNCIDRMVQKHKPKVVIIEALWVVPEKFVILSRLHPTVTWIIRLHSEVPFLSLEGNAFGWVAEYLKHPNVFVSANAPRMDDSLHRLFPEYADKLVYLPNFYPVADTKTTYHRGPGPINIGCFGAIRPLKNQAGQALAAIEFADKKGLKLNFHINSTRIEGTGSPALKNIRAIFEYHSTHELVEHAWMPREEFLGLCSTMDIGMQVSFSETFNIVSADFVTVGTPIVVSREIPWAVKLLTARPSCQKSMVRALEWTYFLPRINRYANYLNLKSYSQRTASHWISALDPWLYTGE